VASLLGPDNHFFRGMGGVLRLLNGISPWYI
jgi:hypothetical protein